MQWEDPDAATVGRFGFIRRTCTRGAVSNSGLAVWLGESLTPLTSMGMLVLSLPPRDLVVFLTELTSNLATTATCYQ